MYRRWVRWLLAAGGTLLFAGCGAPGSAIANLTHNATRANATNVAVIHASAVSKNSSLIQVRYGRTYLLPVPASVRHQTIGVADTPKGVVLLLPPGWTGSQNSHRWLLAMALPNATSTALLSRGAHVLARMTVQPAHDMNLVAITDGFALVTELPQTGGGATATLWSINLTTGATRRMYQWLPSRVNGVPFVSGRGIVAWWDVGTGHATAFDLATNQTVTVANIASADDLGWQDGSLWANGSPVRLPFLTPYSHLLPVGYHWLGSPPLVAIPDGWQASGPEESDGVKAVDTRNANASIVVTTSHCEGCYLAGRVSNGANAVSGPDSPELQLPTGTLLYWLSDHAIAYTLPATKPGYKTFGVTVTAPEGGQVQAEVTVPVAEKSLATTMLNSLWWP